jgi:hypothetical protein
VLQPPPPQGGHRSTPMRKPEERELDAYRQLTDVGTWVRDRSGSAYIDRGSVTEALSGASELDFASLAEALELILLLADEEPESKRW